MEDKAHNNELFNENLSCNHNIMTNKIIGQVENAFIKIGYSKNLIQKDYKYVDLFSSCTPIRTVNYALFGQEPFDYRSACFGIQIAAPNRSTDDVANELKSLGAPQIFIINNGKTERWAITESEPLLKDKYETACLPNVIAQNLRDWEPQAIIRAKSGFARPGPRQLDFVDIGLLPAIDYKASQKIDHLLRAVLNYAEEDFHERDLLFDAPAVFQVVFSLLAAKVLKDRNICNAKGIDFSIPQTALQAIYEHYGFSLTTPASKIPELTLESISQKIGKIFPLNNISVDTLTYIYENTFVSQKSRQELGIHSTPSYVADYILSQIPIEDLQREQWHVTDPMCGHGIFLIAAMRRMKSLLPGDWDSKQRHTFFIKHLHGIEIDPFSVEVARMCLMLADFPESNSWDLQRQDIFADNILENSMAKTMILVGNPPFENIKGKRPETPKPAELLHRTLPILPNNALIGLVLPRSFLDGSDYKNERTALLSNFKIISVTCLPDRVFLYSDMETTVIVARKQQARKNWNMLYREVRDSERDDFQIRHGVTWEDNVPQSYLKDKMQGRLVVPLLREIWERLEGYTRFGEIVDISIGVQYKPNLGKERLCEIIRDVPFPCSKPGISKVTKGFMQFIAEDTVYMSTDKQYRRFETSTAWELPWDKPKVIVPASRMSRGPWRYAAALDKNGCIVSRRFYSIWPKSKTFDVAMLATLLNSPIAVAFIYAHSFQKDIPKRVYTDIPIPEISIDTKQIIDYLVNHYLKVLRKDETEAKKTLLQIDAEILKLYKLPPRLERQLLDIFWGHQRPVPFEFKGYISSEINAWIPLHIYISEQFNNATPDKIMERIPLIRDTEFINYLKKLGTEE